MPGSASVERRVNMEELVGLSSWSASLSFMTIYYRIEAASCLVPNDLSCSQGSNISSVGINVASVKELGISEAMSATSLLVRPNVIQITKVC